MSTQKRQSRAIAIIGLLLSTGVIVVGAIKPQSAFAGVVPESRADHCHGPPSKAWCHDRKDAAANQHQTAARRVPCGPPGKQFRCTIAPESTTTARSSGTRAPIQSGPPGRWPPYRNRR